MERERGRARELGTYTKKRNITVAHTAALYVCVYGRRERDGRKKQQKKHTLK